MEPRNSDSKYILVINLFPKALAWYSITVEPFIVHNTRRGRNVTKGTAVRQTTVQVFW